MNLVDNLNIYQKIEKAIVFIAKNKTKKIVTKDIAAHLHMSEFHFHRLFTRWAGTTPDRFFKYLKKKYIISKLENHSFTQLTYQAGLSNPSGMHDLFITYEALTPGEYKQKGKKVSVSYGFHHTPFGTCFLALTGKGILELQFVKEQDKRCVALLQERYCNAGIMENKKKTKSVIEKIFTINKTQKEKPFHLLLQGTNFQLKVWEALLHIPFGCITSYEKIAEYIGNPSAFRAVGNAIAKNNIAYLIPCHRVINKIGKIGNYRWGKQRKKIMLGREFVQKNYEYTDN